jgi:hypothetical protein
MGRQKIVLVQYLDKILILFGLSENDCVLH